MTILFLDFDGVLHPLLRREPDFCRTKLLWKILLACPDVKVVFSTSWRDIYLFDELVNFVTSGGSEHLAVRFIGTTPKIDGLHGRRDLEIQHWLDTNGHSGQWLAIDDMLGLFLDEYPNLYLIDGSRGLTDADVLAIIERVFIGNRMRKDDDMAYCTLTTFIATK